MKRRDFLIGAGAALTVPATAIASENRVALVQVMKAQRSLQLISADRRILKSYQIQLGANPVGPKRVQGDGKTPEGAYRIRSRNPQSQFFRSLHIDYPRRHDLTLAQRLGRSPGGDIFIHGQPNGQRHTFNHDWTRGCIAVSNEDMEELFRVIPVGTQINIFA